MPQLNATISPGLRRALVNYAERTQESVAHIVSKALVTWDCTALCNHCSRPV